MKLRWVSNTHDPQDKDARRYVTARIGETQEEAWQHQLDWLKGKVIGEPQATKYYTVEQLKAQKFVGVYIAE